MGIGRDTCDWAALIFSLACRRGEREAQAHRRLAARESPLNVVESF